MARRDRITMVRRANPKQVTLPNSRSFLARCRLATRAELPANVHLNRPYKQRAAPKGQRRRARQGGRGFKSAFKKAFNFAKKISKNKAVRNIGRAIISEAAGALESLSKKVKNKKLKAILNSDIAKTGVDLATGSHWINFNKFLMAGISNETIVKFFENETDDDLTRVHY